MKDINLTALNGTITVETRTDGGIGVYYEINTNSVNTLMMNKEQMLKLAGWLVTYIEEKK